MAGPADAKKVSAKQKSKITRQLRKAVKHNPKVVNKRWFLKKASLVNFKLPVTVRLRGSSAASNPNNATIDLGASLGQREIDLGGSLAAEIVFHDSYDGGALGNVDVNILKGPKALTSTSVPLLWNDQVNAPGTSWDSNLLNFAGVPSANLAALGHAPGCGDVLNSNANGLGNLPFGKGVLAGLSQPSPGSVIGPTGLGLPGPPIYAGLSETGFAAAHIASTNPAVDNSINGVTASKIPGNSDKIGGNPSPFPNPPYASPYSTPGSPTYNNASNTVLRTNALSLTIAQPGTEVNNTGQAAIGGDPNGVSGSQNIVIGKSGGQANLFGKIPGKNFGIDVTVNLATKINSILRIVDQDADRIPQEGGSWPAAIFTCTQIWTGYVQNYIPGVRLSGSLKIAPAITSDGHLRIAKALLSSNGFDDARVALSACLMPQQAYNQELPANVLVPTGLSLPPAVNAAKQQPDGSIKPTLLPADPNNEATPPNVTCNSAPSALVANSALPPSTVTQLTGASTLNGYTVTNSGAAVSVAGDLKVNAVEADILVGDV